MVAAIIMYRKRLNVKKKRRTTLVYEKIALLRNREKQQELTLYLICPRVEDAKLLLPPLFGKKRKEGRKKRKDHCVVIKKGQAALSKSQVWFTQITRCASESTMLAHESCAGQSATEYHTLLTFWAGHKTYPYRRFASTLREPAPLNFVRC